MKRHLRRTSVRVVLLVVSAFGAVLWTVDAVWSMQEPAEVARMSKQMKTVCVGRFLIDVPASAQVSISSAAIAQLRRALSRAKQSPLLQQQQLLPHLLR